jgi:hypothetical protein
MSTHEPDVAGSRQRIPADQDQDRSAAGRPPDPESLHGPERPEAAEQRSHQQLQGTAGDPLHDPAGKQARARDDQEGRGRAKDGGRSARAVTPKLTTMNATSRPSSSTPLNARTNAVQSTPRPVAAAGDTVRSPIPRKPLVLTRMTPLRSHCRPKTSSSDPTTSRNPPMGTAVSAVPSTRTRTASTARPAPAPSHVERHPRTLPTPTTMITISMTSTQAARNVVAKTEE